jgi:hypothetical protein
MSEDPAPVPRSRPIVVRRTPARDKIALHISKAVTESWTARKLAQVAGVDHHTAANELAKASAQLHTKSQQLIGIETQKLAQEARKARKRALDRLEALGQVVDNVTTKLQAKGLDASAKDLKEAVAAASQLWKHTESLTGLDVAKVAATRQAVASNEQVTSWDGVAALEAMPADY